MFETQRFLNFIVGIFILTEYVSIFTGATTPIYILGLYPMGGYWPAGSGLLPASYMAINDINNNSEILTEYELKLVVADTQVRKIDILLTILFSFSTFPINNCLFYPCFLPCFKVYHIRKCLLGRCSRYWGLKQFSRGHFCSWNVSYGKTAFIKCTRISANLSVT